MNERLEISSATGVDLDLRIAGPGARSYAFIIDWHFRLLIAIAWWVIASYVLYGSLTPGELGDDAGKFGWLVVLPSAALYLLYHPVLEIAMQGRTPGKRMAGVRIVSVEGQTPSVLAHLIRNALRLLDSLPTMYTLGLLTTVFTKNSVRIGDLAAGTLLIYEADERARSDTRPDIPAAAVSHFGLEKAELAWDLLERWDSLENDACERLAAALLKQLKPDLQLTGDADSLRVQLQRLMEQPA